MGTCVDAAPAGRLNAAEPSLRSAALANLDLRVRASPLIFGGSLRPAEMRSHFLYPALICILPPLAALGLWAGSGRENLTKSTKNVQVEAVDDVFGDRITRTEARRGPVFGYFVGLDAVAGAAAVGLMAGGVWIWRLRRGVKSTGAARDAGNSL